MLFGAVSDVAVDGWALKVDPNLLSQAALAQAIGMTLGNFFTHAGVLCGLTETCYTNLLRIDAPLPLEVVARFAGFLHVLTTAFVVLTREGASDPNKQSVTPRRFLTLVWGLTSRRPFRILVMVLLTSRLPFSLTEGNTLPAVEFVRAGGEFDKLASVLALQYPFQGILGVLVARRLASATSDPTKVWLQSHTILLSLALLTPAATSGVGRLVAPTQSLEARWLGALLLGLVMAASNTVNKAVFIAMGTYFNQITDEVAGGTIITLLWSLSNCGRFIPRTPAFWVATKIGPCLKN